MKKPLRFWIPNGLMLFLMVASAVMYFVHAEQIAEVFVQLQYPVYTMYFNAVSKILGGLAIALPQFPRWVKEFAYAGYLYIILLAGQAVIMTMPGVPWVIIVSVALWAWAYYEFHKRA